MKGLDCCTTSGLVVTQRAWLLHNELGWYNELGCYTREGAWLLHNELGCYTREGAWLLHNGLGCYTMSLVVTQ